MSTSSSSTPNSTSTTTSTSPPPPKKILQPLASYLRTHLQIRNRQHFKLLYKSTFISSEFISLLLSLSLPSCPTRSSAAEIGRVMIKEGLVKYCVGGSGNGGVCFNGEFEDGFVYFRFAEDVGFDDCVISKCYVPKVYDGVNNNGSGSGSGSGDVVEAGEGESINNGNYNTPSNLYSELRNSCAGRGSAAVKLEIAVMKQQRTLDANTSASASANAKTTNGGRALDGLETLPFVIQPAVTIEALISANNNSSSSSSSSSPKSTTTANNSEIESESANKEVVLNNFKFASHTSHNSLILDLALANRLERIFGYSPSDKDKDEDKYEKQKHTFEEEEEQTQTLTLLRQRVRDQGSALLDNHSNNNTDNDDNDGNCNNDNTNNDSSDSDGWKYIGSTVRRNSVPVTGTGGSGGSGSDAGSGRIERRTGVNCLTSSSTKSGGGWSSCNNASDSTSSSSSSSSSKSTSSFSSAVSSATSIESSHASTHTSISPTSSSSSDTNNNANANTNQKEQEDYNLIKTYKKPTLRGTFQTTKVTGYIDVSPLDFVNGLINEGEEFDGGDAGGGGGSGGVNKAVTVCVLRRDNADADADDDSDGGNNNNKDKDPPPLSPPLKTHQITTPLKPAIIPATIPSPSSTPQNENENEATSTPTPKPYYDPLWKLTLFSLPPGLPIAKLLDRSVVLNGLTERILESEREPDCMICSIPLPLHSHTNTNTNINTSHQAETSTSTEKRMICACCGIIVCPTCCSRFVYEVYSRVTVRVCVHCYSESSRIRYPREKSSVGIRGGGEVEYVSLKEIEGVGGDYGNNNRDSNGNGGVIMSSEPSSSPPPPTTSATATVVATAVAVPKWARCKHCGESVNRTMEAIEEHSETCTDTQTANKRRISEATSASTSSSSRSASNYEGVRVRSGSRKTSKEKEKLKLKEKEASMSINITEHLGSPSGAFDVHGRLGGVPRYRCPSNGSRMRRPLTCGTTRIVYRTLHPPSPSPLPGNTITPNTPVTTNTNTSSLFNVINPYTYTSLLPFPSPKEGPRREVCVFQDSFYDQHTGVACLYEISVIDKRVYGCSGHGCSEVLFSGYIVRPCEDREGDERSERDTESERESESVCGDDGNDSPSHSYSSSTSTPTPTSNAPPNAVKSFLTVINQVDTRTMSMTPSWFTGMLLNVGGGYYGDASGVTADMAALFEKRNEELEKGKKGTVLIGREGGLACLDEDDEEMEEIDQTAQIQTTTEEKEEEEEEVSLKHFTLLSVLGRGGFGKVLLVLHPTTNKLYAMKILSIPHLLKRNQIERTATERHVLERLQSGDNGGCPFIVSLAWAFKTVSKVYMVMDFVQGGDFFSLIRKFETTQINPITNIITSKGMNEEWVKMYTAEIALALEHMHALDVVYRDLKPENVLLERDGHVKLTDFGLSRSFRTRPAANSGSANANDSGSGSKSVNGRLTTRSFCGTEQYMAPEMLLQLGHTKAVDWWCLGILMHEMLSCRHPFARYSPPSSSSSPVDGMGKGIQEIKGTHYETLKNMVSKPPTLSPHLSENAKSLCKELLIKDAAKRIACRPYANPNSGGSGGVNDLKKHPFFSPLDWNVVLKKEHPAPYLPTVDGGGDVRNFDGVFTSEVAVDSVVDYGCGDGYGGGVSVAKVKVGKTNANANANTMVQRFIGAMWGKGTVGGGGGGEEGKVVEVNYEKMKKEMQAMEEKEVLKQFDGFGFKSGGAFGIGKDGGGGSGSGGGGGEGGK